MKTLLLSVDDIRTIVLETGVDSLMDEMIGRLEAALENFDKEKTVIPLRDGFEYDEPESGLLEWMPLLQVGEKATIKIVGYNPSSPALRKLPTIISAITAFDTSSGHLIALADGTFLTALRTGAASAVATKILGRPDSRIVGMIGCGVQAVTQLHALSRIFKFETALVYDTDPSVVETIKARTSFVEIDVIRAAPEELLRESDILCTATSVEKGEGPVFPDGECKPWLHINAVGSDFPGKFEIPASLLKRSFVCPDFLDQALKEGECQHLHHDEIGPDLVQLVKEREKYRSVQKQMSVFDSTGWALEDHAALDLFIERAKELGLGTLVQIECKSDDPRNPYGFLDKPTGVMGTGGEHYYSRRLL